MGCGAPRVWGSLLWRRGAGRSTLQRPFLIGERPAMRDPLSEVVELLQPRAVFAKGITGAGRWAVRYSDFGEPSFCAVLDGRCRLAVDGHAPCVLEAGDSVLLPATPGFTLSSIEDAPPVHVDPKRSPAPTGEIRHGSKGG